MTLGYVIEQRLVGTRLSVRFRNKVAGLILACQPYHKGLCGTA